MSCSLEPPGEQVTAAHIGRPATAFKHMSKQVRREEVTYPRSPRASRWQNWDSNPGLPDPRAHLREVRDPWVRVPQVGPSNTASVKQGPNSTVSIIVVVMKSVTITC